MTPEIVPGDEQFRAVIYCRVSTDDKDQTNDTQERVCREWCESKGFVILDVYRDEESGTTLDRPNFSRMLSRIMLSRDVDYIVAYDQSRITRGEDFNDLKKSLSEFRCRFRFVRLDLDDSTMVGKIAQDVMMHVNNEENIIRNERTRAGMQTRKLRDKQHLGRPARIVFVEDREGMLIGRVKENYTILVTEDYIMSFARKGYSLNFVASKILHVSYHSLVREMRPRDPSDPKCRNTGTKDRYSEYARILKESTEGMSKGCVEQRVGNGAESVEQRVVS